MNNAHELDAKARFVKAARSFCDFAELPYAGDDREMHVVRRHLATLFDLGIALPYCTMYEYDPAPLPEDAWGEVFKRFGSLPVNYYGEVCDPLEVPADTAGLGDLADDLADTWRDLKRGLSLFDAGYEEDAAAYWYESFHIHWGEHVSSALRVVQYWCTRTAGNAHREP